MIKNGYQRVMLILFKTCIILQQYLSLQISATLFKRGETQRNQTPRLLIDLNKPYIPEGISSNGEGATHFTEQMIGLVEEQSRSELPAHRHYEHTSSYVYKPRKDASQYSQSKEAKRKRDELQRRREGGQEQYRAYLKVQNAKKQMKRRNRVPRPTRKEDAKISEARKLVREGRGSEEHEKIVNRRKELERNYREKGKRKEQEKLNYMKLYRSRVREGVASPQEIAKVQRWQERDRLYQKNRRFQDKQQSNPSS